MGREILAFQDHIAGRDVEWRADAPETVWDGRYYHTRDYYVAMVQFIDSCKSKYQRIRNATED